MNHIIRVLGKSKMINWFSPQAVCSSTFCSERRWKLLSWSFKRRSRAWAMRYDAVSIICGKIRPSWLNIASFLPDFQTDFSLIQKWKGKRFRHFGVGSNRHQCFSKYMWHVGPTFRCNCCVADQNECRTSCVKGSVWVWKIWKRCLFDFSTEPCRHSWCPSWPARPRFFLREAHLKIQFHRIPWAFWAFADSTKSWMWLLRIVNVL